ncbi:hypothetical protein CHARACLAT_030256 [Characodon lateralis]|uniref:Uncharacterized protein n=1 Tax=Characodon lateralis TaxID=208331 RepID=A0ABU7F794_9TELE|nr:hypothetical protein [Characodon lateralis]
MSLSLSSSAYPGLGRRGSSLSRDTDFPLPRHLLQLFGREPKAFEGQSGDIVPLACTGLSPGPPPGGLCLKPFTKEVSRGHSKQMNGSPQLTLLNVEEQQLYSQTPSGWPSTAGGGPTGTWP